jgi:hypothetical protein
MGGDPVYIDAVYAAFSPRTGTQAEPVWADPCDASATLKNSADIKGKIALIARGKVDWFDKVKHAENAGAVGVVFVNTEDSLDPLPVAGNTRLKSKIPCIMVAKNALNTPRLLKKTFGRAPLPTHSNPDGPSACSIFPATLGYAGQIDFEAIIKASQGKWSDPHFPPEVSSLFIAPDQPYMGNAEMWPRGIVWKRPEELSRKPCLFVDEEGQQGDGGAEANKVLQGAIGDCYFLSSAAILCSAMGKHLVQKLFICENYFDKGLVGLRFFKEGRWMDVAVDTYIPCMCSYDNPNYIYPFAARNCDPNEFWMCFLEKGYAKIHGSYESLDAGNMNESLEDLTGGAPGSVGVLDLFSACMEGGKCDRSKALRLLVDHAHGSLLQGAIASGGDETPIGHGLLAGHVYSINRTVTTSAGQTLVQLRNPWGSHEWHGAWNDKDMRWTEALKKEVGQKGKEDGMFWMSIEDFASSFDTITFVDLVPPSFTILRAESAWTKETAGGIKGNYGQNPQLLIKVHCNTDITISMNQPDQRMKYKHMGASGKAHFDETMGAHDNFIIFQVYKSNVRMRGPDNRKMITNVAGQLRTISAMLKDVEPGEYIVVAMTAEPCEMPFRMRFWSKEKIDLVDTQGGRDWQIFDGSLQQIDHAGVPLKGTDNGGAVIEAATDYEGVSESDIQNFPRLKKGRPADIASIIPGITDGLKKASWKVGEEIPSSWQHGSDFVMAPHNSFVPGEMTAIMRSDRSIRFSKISKIETKGIYEVAVSHASSGGYMYKTGVPGQYLAKLSMVQGYPAALVEQVGVLFDLLDADCSGYLELSWNSSELKSDVGRRLLKEMGVDPDNFQDTYQAMKALDANGDGRVDRQEFIRWMAERSLELA